MKIMKNALCILLCSSLVGTACGQTQELENKPENLRFAMELAGGYGLSNRNYRTLGFTFFTTGNIEQWDEEPAPYWESGLLFHVYSKRFFSFHTGVKYQSMQIERPYYTSSQVVLSPNGAVVSIESIDRIERNEDNLLAIPIGVGFRVRDGKKLDVRLQLGVNVQMYLNSRETIEDIAGISTPTTERTFEKDDYLSPAYAPYGNLALEYELNSRFTINAGLHYTHQITNFYSERANIWQRWMAGYGTLGASYRFGKR
jgi:hypothetical protein